MRRLTAVITVGLAALVWAAAALAADPTVRGYGGGAGVIQREVERKGGGGALPFTGLDLGLLIGGGLVLLLVGASLWRLTREKA